MREILHLTSRKRTALMHHACYRLMMEFLVVKMLQMSTTFFLVSVAVIITAQPTENIKINSNIDGNKLGVDDAIHDDANIHLAANSYKVTEVKMKLIELKHRLRMRRTTGTKSICFPVKKAFCKTFTVKGVTKDYCITKIVHIMCTALD